jgi:hypothetical protein
VGQLDAEYVAPTPIGANLPIWVLIFTLSRRLAEMALDVSRRGVQLKQVGFGDNGIDECFDDHS